MLDALKILGFLSLPDAPHVMKRIWTFLIGLNEDNPMDIHDQLVSAKPIQIAHYRSVEAGKFFVCFTV